MRRRRGGPAPAEPCGVWLDTAELKRGPARPLSARLKAPVRKQSPALLPQPGSRQTTIPTFFSPHSGEGDKENSRPAPCSPAEGCGGSGLPLPAWPVKILALPQLEGAREEPPGAEQGVQGTAQARRTPLGALELQSPVRAQPLRERGQLPEGSHGQLFSQDSQGNRVIAHRPRGSPPRGSPPRGLRLEVGSEPLFTQDSEGNWVIKHWE
ncbi:hypothetical protein DV515_00015179 [Chloebia gouldiae]|uniref:Uncharacterized protein n=1 Tax=Chloebia gouldiae TaxID=44316 RepID=A0A3L8RXL8_CHLGU|nr:hypothetical protein DV515_00015179 [Chloebia gouldiae]